MESADMPAAVQAAIAAQRAVYRRLLRAHMPEWIQLDLSMGQLKTLMALASQGPLTVSGVAETLEVGKPAASILVDRLVQLGYVARAEDPADRRRTLVSLTPSGGDLVAWLRQGKADHFVRWLAAMAPDDLAALTRGMQALAAIAERDDPPLDPLPPAALDPHDGPSMSEPPSGR
jgi:DNA-binding MarR family transcriptional regulator